MHETDLDKSLNQIIGVLPQDAIDGSALAATCLTLYDKPLKDFTVENLRVMIGQNMGLKFLIPLAVEFLRENPFTAGDFYPGDLLSVVMQVDPRFWQTHQDLYSNVAEIVAGLPPIMSDLTDVINRFEALTVAED